MKHTFISKILLTATAVMFLFSACQKDTVTLKARFEQFNNGSKLHLSDRTSSWDAGDQIYIDGYWYQINSNGNISDVRASNRYVAYFVTPNTVTDPDDGPARFTIPAEQQYTVNPTTHNQKVIAPMYANSTNTTLAFKNMGAVLAIQLSNTSTFSSLTIDKIEITASNLLLWGTAVIDDTDPSAPTFSCLEGTDPAAQRTLTLNFANNLTVSTGVDPDPIYVSVPPVLGNANNRFTIKVYTHQGGTRVEYTRSQTVDYSGSILRNQWANVPFALSTDVQYIRSESNLPDGILNYNYVFSVSSGTNGKKVYFSQGNLQYDIDNDRWQFAATQQATIGDANITNLRNGHGVIDLFGWGTSGVNGISPTCTSTNPADYANATLTVGLTGSDWGSNVIYNGAIPEGASATWRTLTSIEYIYLLGLGGNSTTRRKVDGTRDGDGHYGRLYDFDIVRLGQNGPIGVLIYPNASDDVTQSGSLQYSLHPQFTPYDATQTFTITSLQDYPGCVFLPASGQRSGLPDDVNTLGHDLGPLAYWTATYNNGPANVFSLSSDYQIRSPQPIVGASRHYGCSVRLVYNAN